MKLVFVLLCSFAPIWGSSIRAITQNGELKGTNYTLPNGRVINAFYGIPFAAPPVGRNRFEPPSPAENWKGIRDATFARSACVQFFGMPGRSREGNEDCLYLNVFTPKEKKNTSLMNVMVYIHGGAFLFGSGRNVFPDYILQNDDIVFVTINYRLGPLGFFSTQNLVPGNNALKDQVAALQWVQENIRNFGGDPAKVTIYGVSAGAVSVHYHMISPLSIGLFHNAVSASGSVLNPWAYVPQTPKHSVELASFSDCPIHDSELMLRCLKSKPIDKIIESNERLVNSIVQEKEHYGNSSHGGQEKRPFLLFGPITEPKNRLAFLPRHPFSLLKSKKVKNLPWIFGVVEKEGTMPGMAIVTDNNALRALNENWNKEAPLLLHYDHLNSVSEKEHISSAVKQFYFGNKPISNRTTNEVFQVLGDRIFYNGVIQGAKLYISANQENTYCYKFNYRGSESICDVFPGSDEQSYGTCHADDQFYLVKFTGNEAKQNKQDRFMAKFMSSSVITFMRNGDPNFGAVNWQPVSKNSTVDCLNIYSPSLQKMENIEDQKSLQFWENVLPLEKDYWEDPRGI